MEVTHMFLLRKSNYSNSHSRNTLFQDAGKFQDIFQALSRSDQTKIHNLIELSVTVRQANGYTAANGNDGRTPTHPRGHSAHVSLFKAVRKNDVLTEQKREK